LEGAATVTISTNFQWKYLVKKRGRRSELFFSVLLGIELPELSSMMKQQQQLVEDDPSFSFAFILRNLHFPLL